MTRETVGAAPARPLTTAPQGSPWDVAAGACGAGREPGAGSAAARQRPPPPRAHGRQDRRQRRRDRREGSWRGVQRPGLPWSPPPASRAERPGPLCLWCDGGSPVQTVPWSLQLHWENSDVSLIKMLLILVRDKHPLPASLSWNSAQHRSTRPQETEPSGSAKVS